MDIDDVKGSLSRTLMNGVDVYERRHGEYQLIIPILHEDGDMVDVYVRESPRGEGFIRICDFGLTLMRLSYTFDISTPARQQIFDSILINSNVRNDGGNLYIDTPLYLLYENVLQFVGCAQKVCNMRYWSREVVHSAFYEDLKDYIVSELTRFSPVPDQTPLPDYAIISVDWTLTLNRRNFYVFGVRGNDKAKNVAISLLEFQKVRLPFISMVVHENIEDLGRKESRYLTRNADVQYPVLDDFKEKGMQDFDRFAGVLQ